MSMLPPYTNLESRVTMWTVQEKTAPPMRKTSSVFKNLCIVSVVFAFSVGLTVGLVIPLVYLKEDAGNSSTTAVAAAVTADGNNSEVIRSIFLNNSYGHKNASFQPVSFLEPPQEDEEDEEESIVTGGIYWGRRVEDALPEGYRRKKHNLWSDYVKTAEAVKMENGCGRMQNRLLTFKDGVKGCVRYRQNTDQIQGELFSFYLARILKLPNLAPSTVSIVDLKKPLWQNLRNEIASAQWNSNRPIVLTQFISDLDAASIPNAFKPVDRHLNRDDVLNMTKNELVDGAELTRNLVELAQWSDLIIFDYLTANLDRFVNNLFNYQWNPNIMDAPAHNLAKMSNSDLLIFLDNESGLLHGYRLLKKYEIYHSILLENLCVFRKRTADVVKELLSDGNVGELLRTMFEEENSEYIKDILPTIPDKSVKILNERLERVYGQIDKCQKMYGSRT